MSFRLPSIGANIVNTGTLNLVDEKGTIIGSLMVINGQIVPFGINLGNTGGGGGGGSSGNKVYNDDWFEQNLTQQPPGPTGISSVNFETQVVPFTKTQNQNIGFTFIPPQQTVFGNMLVPYINNLTATIVPPLGSSLSPIPINLDNSSYLPGGNSTVTGFYFNRVGNTGYNTSINSNNNISYVYVYGNTGLNSYISNNQIQINLSYSNSNAPGTINNVPVTLTNYATALPPTNPRNVFLGDSGPTTAAISWLPPLFNAGQNNINGDAELTNYKVDYNYVSTLYRNQPNEGFTGTVITTAGITGTTLTNLYPWSTYTLDVSAKNFLPNIGYGDGTSTGPGITTKNVYTLGIPGPSAPSFTISLPQTDFMSGSTPTPLRFVSNRNLVPSNIPVYNAVISNNTKTLGTNLNMPIQLDNAPGKTGAVGDINPTAGIEIIGTIAAVPPVDNQALRGGKWDFYGFGNPNSVYTQTGAPATPQAEITLNSPGLTDYYSSDLVSYQKFYQTSQVGALLYPSNIPPTGNTGSVQLHSVNYSNSGVPTDVYSNTLIFGIESLAAGTEGPISPTISTWNISGSTNGIPRKYITGVNIAGNTSNNNVITYSLSASNFGNYFYRGDQIAIFTSSLISSSRTLQTLPSSFSGTNMGTNTLNWENQTFNIIFNNNAYAVTLPLTVNVQSINNNITSDTTSGGENVPIIVDALSYNLSQGSSLQNVGTLDITYSQGYRMNVGQLPSVAEQGIYSNFDNNSSLIDNNLNLPIFKGRYCTNGFESGISNYFSNVLNYGGSPSQSAFNYSSLNSETSANYRYATFGWKVDMSSAANIQYIRIRFNNWNANGLVVRDTNTSSLIYTGGAGGYQAYYKVIEVNNANPPDIITATSSYWINANLNVDQTFKLAFNQSSSNTTLGGLFWGDNDVSAGVNYPGNENFTYNLTWNPFTPSSRPSGNQIYVYFCVGMSMNANISFSDVSCSFSNGST